MKRIYYTFCLAFIVMLLSTLLSGCGTKVTEGSTVEASPSAALPYVSTEKPKTPSPGSMSSVQWECGTYYSDISYANLQAYLQMLEEDGWRDFDGSDLSTNINEGKTDYTLAKDNQLLQMIIDLNDKEGSLPNSILVREDEKLDIEGIKARESAVTKEDAVKKIQQYVNHAVDSGEIPCPYKTVTGVIELFIRDAYEKLNMQAFAAFSDTGFYGCFLIRKGVVSFVEGNLKNACVADIDKDDKYELIDLYSAWDSGIMKYNLIAYEYINPIYFNSPTEILQVKYSNCFVPKADMEDLLLEKIDDNTVRLYSNSKDYGNIMIDGSTLTVSNMQDFPYELWSTYYDQDILKGIDKVIPDKPPVIGIDIDGTAISCSVKETDWNGEKTEYTIADAFCDIMDQGGFVPTFKLSNMIETEISLPATIDFGDSIPDSILIYDAMLNTDGSLRYGERLIQNQGFKIVDDSHIEFDLKQHMSYFLSSNSGDYERDWYRLFRMVCTWGDKECTYAFLINTGNTEKVKSTQNNMIDGVEITIQKIGYN